ncbi:MAG: methyltransferase domain-containing protein [Actinomycetota bacterium]|nr:methyltransferase domain-containing protein [Actinomycetota bacterium]
MDSEGSSNDDRLEQVHRRGLAEWEAMAPGWEHRREYLREFAQPIADWMVAQLDPQPGQTILELGAGTGETGFAASRLIGDGGRLISTDLPPGMVDVAKRRAAELGVENAEFRVMDAQRMDLEDGTVDGILCRWAYMLMADPAAAMSESRRVLRPGGRHALAVMGGPVENPWAASVAKSIVGLGLIPPIDSNAPGGLFSLADHAVLRDLLTRAGFENVRIEETEFHLWFSDFEDYWSFISEFAGAVAMLLRSFSDEERAAVREATVRATEGFRTDQGYDLPGRSVNALAS